VSHNVTRSSRRSTTRIGGGDRVEKGKSRTICCKFSADVLYAHRDGPLQVYIRAGKMIPHIVNPWLNIQQVFTTGLSSDGHMQIERLSDALENDTEVRYFFIIVCQVYALNIILQ
jgi:hypothetical protein